MYLVFISFSHHQLSTFLIEKPVQNNSKLRIQWNDVWFCFYSLHFHFILILHWQTSTSNMSIFHFQHSPCHCFNSTTSNQLKYICWDLRFKILKQPSPTKNLIQIISHVFTHFSLFSNYINSILCCSQLESNISAEFNNLG